MSLAAFQQNLTALLRCPEDWRPEGELTPAEFDSIVALAKDAELNKYAHEQREQRWLATSKKIPRLVRLVGEELLYDLWLDIFDPEHAQVTSDGTSLAGTYTLAFLEFLATSDEVAQSFADTGVPAYVHDVLAFERAELELSLPVDLGAFRTVELRHDLLGAGEPPVRRVLAALVRRGFGQQPRIFEIDDAMHAVLQGLAGQGRWIEPSEAALADLTAMGLADLVAAARRH